MLDFIDGSLFLAELSDRRFIAAAFMAALSGWVRGFSGFGSALVYIPLVAAIYNPKIAAATLLLVDFVCSTPYTVRALPHCNWREVLPLAVAGTAAIPLGTLALVFLDPVLLRWIIVALVLSLLVVLASGWRYHGKPILPVTILVGIVAGIGAGAVQIGGPAVIIYWLGSASEMRTVRANLMTYFLFISIALIVSYTSQGLLTRQVFVLAVLICIPFIIGIVLGTRGFHRSSERSYRSTAYAIVAAAALVSLPIFDGIFR